MYGHRTGISSQASFKPFKVSFHYLGHALNLAVNDMVKNVYILKEIFDTLYEISNP